MRHGEIAALHWEDINFDDGSLSVQRTLSHVKEREGKVVRVTERKNQD